MRLLVALLAAAFALPVRAQSPAFDFSIQNIMRGPELYGREPSQVQWTADNRWIYFSWLPPGSDWRERSQPYRVRPVAGAKPERVTDAHMDSVGPLLGNGVLSNDHRYRAAEFAGDLYLADTKLGTVRRLTETIAMERAPEFDVEGRRVFFVRDNNVFAMDIDGGLVRQLTDIRSGTAPRDSAAATGQRGVLEQQQRELFDVIRDRLRLDSIATAERKAREALRVKPLYIAANERVVSLEVSPNGKALLITTNIPPVGTRDADIPQYVTSSGYTEELRSRTKVGDAQSTGRVAFVSLPSGSTKWLAVSPGDSAKPTSSASVLGWNPSGTTALLFATSRDFKSRFITTVSADSGRVRVVDTLTDSAWVDGPCYGCGGWYDDGRRFWFVSEASGYSHLWTAAADGSDKKQLTTGKWEVLDVSLSPDRKSFLLHTSEVSPFDRHVYRMPIAGGARERLTTQKGGHTAVLSPDGTMLADVFSTSNRPPELFVMKAAPRADMAQLTTSPTADWLAFGWKTPEIVMIPASDGVQVPARIYRPADMGARPNGAGVLFVHGAGYLHNVHNYWSTYSREYMFNHYLASKGYVVLDIDYRGSAGYGRDWRTAVYRHMGGRDLQDHVDGSRYLQKEFGIDPERVGLYGGSYGGFITLMALFTEPKWFGAGGALRSVTDWAHYNHGYTARILNSPDADSISYRQSSPIYFAQGLEDPLLMAHGMVDSNVHFQDIVRLSQRLIELGKTGWELAVYPVENHGFTRPSSWTDEYRRIFELFERSLAKPGAKAAENPR
jgi:dipeptidyl aminopeptidase/acylaminoacyl peptidase